MAFDSLSDKLQNVFKKLRSKGVLTEDDVKEAMKEVKMVVEGVYSAKAALKLAEKYHVTMPIVEQVNEVLFDGKSAKDAPAELMLRDKRMENTSLIWDKE